MTSQQPAIVVEQRVDVLDAWLDHISAVVAECRLRATDDGLHVAAVDAANVMMIETSLDAGECETFECNPRAAWEREELRNGDMVRAAVTYVGDDEDHPLYGRELGETYRAHGRPEYGDGEGDVGEITLGVDVGRLQNCLSAGDKDDTARLEYHNAISTLHVEVGGHSFEVRTIKPDAIRLEPDLPDLDLGSEWTVSQTTLREMLLIAEDMSDYVSLTADGTEALLEAEGDTDTYSRRLNGADRWTRSPETPVQSLYSLDYLASYARTLPKRGEATVELGESYPITIHHPVRRQFTTTEYADVTIMLAPRIQS